MASAEKSGVKLVLSESEARALYSVTGLVSGHMVTSPRRHIDGIREALESVFINYGPPCDGEIKFEDDHPL